jgi:hypothetical protein
MDVLGAWRSLVARTVRVGEVPGSNPGAPITASNAGTRPRVFSFCDPAGTYRTNRELAAGHHLHGFSPAVK